MAQNPPEGFPQITPYLLYEDVDAAVEWLIDTFGFTEHVRMKGPDGKANHAEVKLGDGVVMMGNPGPDYQNPKRRGGATQLVYVYVDNVDKHYEVAKAKGAHVLRDLADQFYGDRTYGAEDPKATIGHLPSTFATWPPKTCIPRVSSRCPTACASVVRCRLPRGDPCWSHN